MPTLFRDFERGLNTVGRVRRDNWGRSSQQNARASRPLGILMIKIQPMIMVRRRVDS
jgi:hypothetical protein